MARKIRKYQLKYFSYDRAYVKHPFEISRSILTFREPLSNDDRCFLLTASTRISEAMKLNKKKPTFMKWKTSRNRSPDIPLIVTICYEITSRRTSRDQIIHVLTSHINCVNFPSRLFHDALRICQLDVREEVIIFPVQDDLDDELAVLFCAWLDQMYVSERYSI